MVAPAASQAGLLTALADYEKEVPPLPSEHPDGRLIVKISIQFMRLLKVDEIQGEIQFSCFYRVWWNDTRLRKFKSPLPMVVLTEHVRKLLWRPDIVTGNVRAVQQSGILKPTIFYALYPSSYTLFYASYIALRVGCPFVYTSYPMDVQVCKIHVGTMGLTIAELDLQWHEIGYSMSRRFLKFHDLFRLKVCESMDEPVRYSAFGQHPQKTLLIVLKRNYKSALIQVYLPSMFFILIAWLSVLVPPTMLRTRLLLNSTNLLTIISMFLSISKTEAARVPKVSYITALNLWMFVCVTFCFSSVLLVVLDIRLVVLLTNPGRKLQTIRDLFRPMSFIAHHSFTDDDGGGDDDDEFWDASDTSAEDLEITESIIQDYVEEERHEWLSRTAGFERVYLIGYPLLFTLFAGAYFIFLLWNRSSQMAWTLTRAGGQGAISPGCWCREDDFEPGCVPETNFIVL
ncbi:glutamate-gated chloride channel subunit beta-like isoform X2 [Pollicipes pollicipes]|uniref:glutamate-gated chloride channel subunit beta-like isoform X2 n=1 Tax=Pollicipes pollicipes TaxID=41117 RepID=UPI0018849610|nr:glutamate-gated chloride channel subunit beta-like isoform X2 [Pollicipes pollicipes]